MPTLLFWQIFWVAEGGVRSHFHGNCQPHIPLQLNTLFHRHGSGEAPFPRGRGECGRECDTARGRERANKFCENTVIQYGRHCVRANGGQGSRPCEERRRRVMINLGWREPQLRPQFSVLPCFGVARSVDYSTVSVSGLKVWSPQDPNWIGHIHRIQQTDILPETWG